MDGAAGFEIIRNRMQRARNINLAFTTLSAIYLYAFPSASIPYAALVLGHVAAGFVLAALSIVALIHARSTGWMVTAAGAGLGMVLAFTGASRPLAPLLYAHIGVSALGVIILLAGGMRRPAAGFAALFVAVGVFSGSAWAVREVRWRDGHRTPNPDMPPASPAKDGDGESGP